MTHIYHDSYENLSPAYNKLYPQFHLTLIFEIKIFAKILWQTKKSVNLRFLLFPHTRLEAGHVSTRVVFTLKKQLTGRIIQQRYNIYSLQFRKPVNSVQFIISYFYSSYDLKNQFWKSMIFRNRPNLTSGDHAVRRDSWVHFSWVIF